MMIQYQQQRQLRPGSNTKAEQFEERRKMIRERQKAEQERLEGLRREQEEKMELAKQKKLQEQQARIQKAREKENLRQQQVHQRRLMKEKEENERKLTMQRRIQEEQENRTPQNKKPTYAFGSSTPRVLSYLERIDGSMRVYDTKLKSAALTEEEKKALADRSLLNDTPNGHHHKMPKNVAFGSTVAPTSPTGTPNKEKRVSPPLDSARGRSPRIDRPLAKKRDNLMTASVISPRKQQPPSTDQPPTKKTPSRNRFYDPMTRSYTPGVGGGGIGRSSDYTPLKSRRSEVKAPVKAPTSSQSGPKVPKRTSAAPVLATATSNQKKGNTSTSSKPPSASSKPQPAKTTPSPNTKVEKQQQRSQKKSPPSSPPDTKKMKSSIDEETLERELNKTYDLEEKTTENSPPTVQEEKSLLDFGGDTTPVIGDTTPTPGTNLTEKDSDLLLVDFGLNTTHDDVSARSAESPTSEAVTITVDAPSPPDIFSPILEKDEGGEVAVAGDDVMTSSMIRERTEQNEEAAKAALAEKRRLAREERERKAEEERLEEERRQRELEEQIRHEEEEFRRIEEEERRCAEEARLEEERRLQRAIEEEAERKEQERLKEEEERRQREVEEVKQQEKLEQERKDREEKLRLEQQEREERKKRLANILGKARGDGAVTPEKSMMQTPTPQAQDRTASPNRLGLSATSTKVLERLAATGKSPLEGILKKHGSNSNLEATTANSSSEDESNNNNVVVTDEERVPPEKTAQLFQGLMNYARDQNGIGGATSIDKDVPNHRTPVSPFDYLRRYFREKVAVEKMKRGSSDTDSTSKQETSTFPTQHQHQQPPLFMNHSDSALN